MTDLQITQLLRAGHTIGSHSYSHPNFAKLSFDAMQKEYIDSKNDLEKRFNVKIKYFAYPYGKRPDLKTEEIFWKTAQYDLMLGTKNNLSNSFAHYSWERDKMEHENLNNGKVWFTYVPILRKYVLNPLRIYK
jgi:peptidoglycan/xylan/chitin deacetylase (PgdA/CDA1 family)